MNGVQTRFKCKLDVKRCKRFVFPPSSLLPRSNALKTKAIRYFQTDQTLTRIVSSPLDNSRTSHQEMTILVAEDYQSNYDLIEAMIGKIYKLVHAHDGMEAIIFYEQYKPDLILMDIKMPNINGLDATRAIREMSADVPVIAVSAYAYEKDKIAAIESGCNDFLTKPVSADLLKMTINKYLKQK